MTYRIEISDAATKDIESFKKAGDLTSLKRLNQILEDLREHPETGIGSPERLKYRLSGYWSRQINRKDRLIYKIYKETVSVTVVSAKGHYSDK